MAILKPGTVVGGYTWTGKRWAKTPERTAEKVSLEKEIQFGKAANRNKEAQVRFPGGQYRPATSSSSKIEKPASSVSTTRGYVPMRSKSSMKAKTTKESGATDSSVKPRSSATPSSSKTSKTSKGLTAGGGRAKTPLSKSKPVSQSRTMWVKKGDVVGGKTVQKGYLAQYGKPEKKVTARVRLVAGEKAGQKVTYRKGRKTK